ncbi:MAG TPA: FkbM family methyltransferase [Pyrinomonadaceae bacterium]|nr:FkbM family methyltransferase [Pyrinomonadaceae bacterium]
MRAAEERPTRLERLAAASVGTLQSVGLGRLAYSGALRRLGKALLLRRDRRPVVRQIASGLGRGLRLRVLPETPRSYWLGTHEPDMQAALREQIKAGMTVYDCGANVGYFSVMLARLVGPRGRVYAFEPSPASLESLRAARDLNGLANLSVVPQGVWDRRARLRFRRGGAGESLVSDHVEGVFGESGARGPREAAVEVEVNSLDDFVYAEGNPPPDFIKLDVEGAEGRALAGARRLLAERRPGLLLEIHGGPGREVWALLEEFGYDAVNLATGDAPRTAEEFAVWISQYLARPARKL